MVSLQMLTMAAYRAMEEKGVRHGNSADCENMVRRNGCNSEGIGGGRPQPSDKGGLFPLCFSHLGVAIHHQPGEGQQAAPELLQGEGLPEQDDAADEDEDLGEKRKCVGVLVLACQKAAPKTNSCEWLGEWTLGGVAQRRQTVFKWPSKFIVSGLVFPTPRKKEKFTPNAKMHVMSTMMVRSVFQWYCINSVGLSKNGRTKQSSTAEKMNSISSKLG